MAQSGIPAPRKGERVANAITDAAAESALVADETSSLTARAYKELEERIVTLQIEPGSVLSETMLAKSLNIGRTPIREALQRLAREGLVVILPRRGLLVSGIHVQASGKESWRERG